MAGDIRAGIGPGAKPLGSSAGRTGGTSSVMIIDRIGGFLPRGRLSPSATATVPGLFLTPGQRSIGVSIKGVVGVGVQGEFLGP